MYSFLLVAPFVTCSQKMLKEGRKRPLQLLPPTTSRPFPGSSHVWSLAVRNGFFCEAGSCARRNISNADSLQREAERSVSNFASALAGKGCASTGSQCAEKRLEGFRKCPITGWAPLACWLASGAAVGQCVTG